MTLDKEALEKAARRLFSANEGIEDAFISFQKAWPTIYPHYINCAEAAITAYLSALSEKGVRLMPREATDAMSDAGVAALGKDRDNIGYTTTPRLWRAMFDAHPEPKP